MYGAVFPSVVKSSLIFYAYLIPFSGGMENNMIRSSLDEHLIGSTGSDI
jgi:hypothetical protein